ncbi:class I SAM-dependent methyltransferase [Nocardia sp. BSTN01]|uniref:class I SAM-dependent methyltransferase n=1 Tax=Nocardia sp. BSTN01 TaxID=2783665 RepID=UPI0018903C91|nr:class I SAM-dependent methyltransferase [Nocardia sp. BSTN01]MBF4999757.1 class I SAM-dependent methyltransferase [Nocardia sp. BSTN01]
MTAIHHTQQSPADLTERTHALWALGDYPRVADTVIPGLGRRLVRACDIRPGQRVLDIAAGAGNAAIPAAEAGADVIASDLTPEMFDAGRAAAAARGVHLAWETADAQALPYDDGRFDVALSCVGIMFAPSHRAAADELLRVTAPNATIGLINWTPEGFIGEMFAIAKRFAPPPPPGAQSPLLWGTADHLRELLGDRVTDLHIEREFATVECFADGDRFRDFFKAHYGPTVAVYKALAGDSDRIAELDCALADLAARHNLGGGRMRWEYLLVTARRA